MRTISLDFYADLSVIELDYHEGKFNSLLHSPGDPALPCRVFVWLDDPRTSSGISPDIPVFVLRSDFNELAQPLFLPEFDRQKLYVLKNAILQPTLSLSVWNR